jgi:hypothetical protein
MFIQCLINKEELSLSVALLNSQTVNIKALKKS